MALLDIVQQEEHIAETAILTMMMDRGTLSRLKGAKTGPIIPKNRWLICHNAWCRAQPELIFRFSRRFRAVRR